MIFILITQSITAPQKLHRRCRSAKQQRIPMGKKNRAQHKPKQVNSVSNIPI